MNGNHGNSGSWPLMLPFLNTLSASLDLTTSRFAMADLFGKEEFFVGVQQDVLISGAPPWQTSP